MVIYNLITLPWKNAVIVKSNYCSWPAWPWRQRHYYPSKCWELLAQQHSVIILQTGTYSIRESCQPRILKSHVWDVTVCSLTGVDVWGDGITSTGMANPNYTPSHPSRLFQQYYQYCSTVASFLLWYLYVSRKVITLLHRFTCFCTVLMRYFYHHYMFLYII